MTYHHYHKKKCQEIDVNHISKRKDRGHTRWYFASFEYADEHLYYGEREEHREGYSTCQPVHFAHKTCRKRVSQFPQGYDVHEVIPDYFADDFGFPSLVYAFSKYIAEPFDEIAASASCEIVPGHIFIDPGHKTFIQILDIRCQRSKIVVCQVSEGIPDNAAACACS